MADRAFRRFLSQYSKWPSIEWIRDEAKRFYLERIADYSDDVRLFAAPYLLFGLLLAVSTWLNVEWLYGTVFTLYMLVSVVGVNAWLAKVNISWSAERSSLKEIFDLYRVDDGRIFGAKKFFWIFFGSTWGMAALWGVHILVVLGPVLLIGLLAELWGISSPLWLALIVGILPYFAFSKTLLKRYVETEVRGSKDGAAGTYPSEEEAALITFYWLSRT